jgi:hypothetical protein
MLLEQISDQNYAGTVPVGKANVYVEVENAKGELIVARFTQIFKKKSDIYLHRREFHIDDINNIINDIDIIRFAKCELNDYKKRIASISRRAATRKVKVRNKY